MPDRHAAPVLVEVDHHADGVRLDVMSGIMVAGKKEQPRSDTVFPIVGRERKRDISLFAVRIHARQREIADMDKRIRGCAVAVYVRHKRSRRGLGIWIRTPGVLVDKRAVEMEIRRKEPLRHDLIIAQF